MPGALILELTGVGEAVNKQLGIDLHTGQGDWPAGLLSHAAGSADDGTFVVSEVWSTRAAQEAFLAGQPGVAFVGRGRLFGGRAARPARTDPGQQCVPPGPPGPGFAPRAASVPGVDQAKGAALAAAAVLAAAAGFFWRVRRRRQARRTAWMEASCPACIAVTRWPAACRCWPT